MWTAWLLLCLVAIQIALANFGDPLPADGTSIGHIDTFQELELKSNVLIPGACSHHQILLSPCPPPRQDPTSPQ